MTLLAEPPIGTTAPALRTPKRWTKQEYNAAAETVLGGQHVYFYRGELIQMPAMGTLHIRGISRLTPWLVYTFDPAYVIRSQGPFELPDESMPQPEFVICTTEQNARLQHPNAAVLIIEVADRSVELDQEMAFGIGWSGVQRGERAFEPTRHSCVGGTGGENEVGDGSRGHRAVAERQAGVGPRRQGRRSRCRHGLRARGRQLADR